MLKLIVSLTISLVAGMVSAEELRIAVASNFIQPMSDITHAFYKKTGHSVQIVSGSSGKHAAQIIHGAPFDLFFSADLQRPEQVATRLNLADVPTIYATGRLVFWWPGSHSPVDEAALRSFDGPLAIANPRLAPYGLAASRVLEHLSQSNATIMAENVSQAYHFVWSGAAQAGMVAWSQLIDQGVDTSEYWVIPENWHPPIHQAVIRLTEQTATRLFLDFVLHDDQAVSIIKQAGYGITLYE